MKARERLTGICQGRPCIIDPEDCNIGYPTLEDFPVPRDSRAEIFIYWVRLCCIIGRVGKHLAQKTESTLFPVHLSGELIGWVQSLPEHLRLPIASNRTAPFNRDVHQLHLPYLTTITLLYLNKASQPLPKACSAAVLAASCVARIFEDYLARKSIRFLPGVAGWYAAIAILALMYARQMASLARSADDHIKVLRIALKEMSKIWNSAKAFDKGFERLLGSNAFPVGEGEGSMNAPSLGLESTLPGLADLPPGDCVNWMDYFPYATPQTSPLVGILLASSHLLPFPDLEWPDNLTMELQDVFGPYDGFDDGEFDI